MIVYLDMDGVLVNFVDRLLTACDSNLTHDDITRWEIHTHLGMTNEAMWERIDDCGEKFWSDMPEYLWTKYLFESIKARGHRIYILTDPCGSPMACAGKIKWIQKNLGRDEEWVLTKHKHLLAKPRTLLIDDYEKNTQRFMNSGGQSLLFPQPWNEKRDLKWEKPTDRVDHILGEMDKLGY